MPTIEEIEQFARHKNYVLPPKQEKVKKANTGKGKLLYWGELLFDGDYKLIQTKKKEFVCQGYNPKGFRIKSI